MLTAVFPIVPCVQQNHYMVGAVVKKTSMKPTGSIQFLKLGCCQYKHWGRGT